MFKKNGTTVNYEKIDTLIGKETKLQGTITVQGTIRVDGTIEGDIAGNGDIIVGESGLIKGNVIANNLFVCGSVNGNILAKSQLHLNSTAKLHGDAETNSLIIEQGALFDGKSKMLSKAPGESGNINAEVAATKDKK